MLDLARDLKMSIRQVERMDSCELSEWMAYWRLDKMDKDRAAMDGNAMSLMNAIKGEVKKV